jgi:hypothetical protein
MLTYRGGNNMMVRRKRKEVPAVLQIILAQKFPMEYQSVNKITRKKFNLSTNTLVENAMV